MPRTAAGDPSVKKSRLASTSIGSTLLHAQQVIKVEEHGIWQAGGPVWRGCAFDAS